MVEIGNEITIEDADSQEGLDESYEDFDENAIDEDGSDINSNLESGQ